MAKTLLDIEEKLLEEARRLAGVRRKRKAVAVALQDTARIGEGGRRERDRV